MTDSDQYTLGLEEGREYMLAPFVTERLALYVANFHGFSEFYRRGFLKAVKERFGDTSDES